MFGMPQAPCGVGGMPMMMMPGMASAPGVGMTPGMLQGSPGMAAGSTAGPMDPASMQSAWASSAVRTSNAAAELHKLMGAAKQMRGAPGGAGSAPTTGGRFPVGGCAALGGGMLPAAFAAGPAGVVTAAAAAAHAAAATTPEALQRTQAQMELQSLAAAAHMQSAQMQQWAQDAEMQRMQIAMQMQMAAASELQNREDVMKRNRPPSPPSDMGARKRRHGEKDNTEYFYDMAQAERNEREDPTCVGTSELVKKVKVIQRSSARGYNAWDSYCLSKGNKTKDPRLHHDDFLQGFFDAIARGDFGDVPGAVAILGDNASRKFTPDAPASDDRNERPYPKAIFIAGLPKHTSEQELQEHFATFGNVQAVRLKFDADGTFRGIGEVEFVEESSAKKVLDNFDYNIFQGRWINCMIAKRKGILGRNPKWWSGTGREP